jgi:precorrin-6B methylase 2
MSLDLVRETASRLSMSHQALAALGLALQTRALGRTLDPRLQAGIDGVLDAIGCRDAVGSLAPDEALPVLAAIRADLLTGPKLMSGTTAPKPGWAHQEDDILQTFGDVSAGFPRHFRARILPQLDALSDALSRPGARFLDIGTGVAALAIAMAKDWPGLSVTAIEPHPPALSLARGNVAYHGLDGRMDLRAGSGEALTDEAAFDLAWVPSAFIPASVIGPILTRVQIALKPGGWLIFAMIRGTPDPLATATTRFRTAFWGGSDMPFEDVRDLMQAAGLTAIRLLDGPSHSTIAMVAARRS